MKSSSVEITEPTESLLLNQLKASTTPMSMQELANNLEHIPSLSHRTLKEAAWKLVEEGKAQFTPGWDLEIL